MTTNLVRKVVHPLAIDGASTHLASKLSPEPSHMLSSDCAVRAAAVRSPETVLAATRGTER
jgi:hypothetical protein